MYYPTTRLRRLRNSSAMRDMLDLPFPPPQKFIWPVFVRSGEGIKEDISSMPGQYRYSIDKLLLALESVVSSGIAGILIFGLANMDEKDSCGSFASCTEGVVQKAIQAVKNKYPNLLVFSDVCLCAYTEHGHCGILNNNGMVDNDATLQYLAATALSHVKAGADVVAPSAMMDGQVQAIRTVLDKNGYGDNAIMSYSTKFASSMYGPFRDAEQSSPGKGDRKGYQSSYANLDLALRESVLDEREGADILMVKPAIFYLDIISKLKEQSKLPVAVYNVSGEYSMLIAMAEKGWGDLQQMVRESTLSLYRAGADIIISYWANQYEQIF